MARDLRKRKNADPLFSASLQKPPPKSPAYNYDSDDSNDPENLELNWTESRSRLKMANALHKTEVDAVVAANSLFSASLQTHLIKENPENLIFSPLSVSTVVAMAKVGARGKTAKEIAKLFHFPSKDETLVKGYSQLLRSLNETNDGVTLCIANKLYCNTGIELKEEYLGAVKKSFGAEVEPIDFAKNTDAAKTINGWVQAATKDKIQDLVNPRFLNADTGMVLVNGIYFKGEWEDEFSLWDTKKANFYTTPHDIVEVDMMNQWNARLRHVKDPNLDASALALPYKGGRLSMIIYLPNKRAGLKQLEDGLKDLTPLKILENMEHGRVDVSLPRFKIESTLELVEPLKKIGLSSMFDKNADFSGIQKFPTADPLFVSEVIQKAVIEVNEKGTEAGAGTGMMMLGGGPPPRSIKFKADHPFLFQIVDVASNSVLFAGCVKKP